MKPPKLYRVVYLELEWVRDECWDGEHHQSCGMVYPRARVVIKNGVKTWQVIDVDIALGPLYEDEINQPADKCIAFDWAAQNVGLKKSIKEMKHNPEFHGFQPLTIKEQAADVIYHDWPY